MATSSSSTTPPTAPTGGEPPPAKRARTGAALIEELTVLVEHPLRANLFRPVSPTGPSSSVGVQARHLNLDPTQRAAPAQGTLAADGHRRSTTDMLTRLERGQHPAQNPVPGTCVRCRKLQPACRLPGCTDACELLACAGCGRHYAKSCAGQPDLALSISRRQCGVCRQRQAEASMAGPSTETVNGQAE